MSDTIFDFESYRTERDYARARQPPEGQLESPFRPRGGDHRRVLSDRQLAHRRRMLDHLQRTKR